MLSAITLEEIKDYCGVTGADSDHLFERMTASARAFISAFTGLDAGELDARDDVDIALFVLVNEMFLNRMYSVDSRSSYASTDAVNPIVRQVLEQHRVNLL